MINNSNKKNNKKGVSGLIVAVLLVAVSLTIGGLVIGWISGYTSDSLSASTKEQKQQDDCFDIDYKVVSVVSNSTAATNKRNSTFNIILENKNTKAIKGFLFKFIPVTGDSVVTKTNTSSTDTLGSYARLTYRLGQVSPSEGGGLDAGQTSGFSKVEVTPIIDVVVDTTVETVCTSKLKTIESTNFASS